MISSINPSTLDRSRLFLYLQLTGWATNGLLSLILLPTLTIPLRDAVIIVLFRTFYGFCLTFGMRPLYRSLERRLGSHWSLVGTVLVFSALVSAIDNFLIFSTIKALNMENALKDTTEIFISALIVRWFIYWVWSLLYFGIRLWFDSTQTKLHLARAETEARASELRFLQAQVNPHFLFNALNTIIAEIDNPQTRDTTLALSEYMRFSLRPHDEYEPIGMELDALEHYLCVEKARYGDRFSYIFRIDEATRSTFTPIASIQPLVENAVKYGRRTSPEHLRIEVDAWQTEIGVHLRVTNSGHWVTPEEHDSPQTGLRNLRRRLSLLYHGRATLVVAPIGETVSAELHLPYITTPTLCKS